MFGTYTYCILSAVVYDWEFEGKNFLNKVYWKLVILSFTANGIFISFFKEIVLRDIQITSLIATDNIPESEKF